jgi:CheY-like chemotaxis protein
LTQYDFSRCSILLVEDDINIRNAFENLLRSFKFGQIETASNGEDAIEYLKVMKQDYHPGPDLIISNLVMSPIDGLLLLRWIRGSKDCPNRMVPFLMISGATSRDDVNSSRDLGANEFIARPFSPTSVYEQILKIIDYPRQFVTSHDYFGPDRRRSINETGAALPERREKSDEDVTIIYSSDKKIMQGTPKGVYYWRLQNTLRSKAAGGPIEHKVKGEIPSDVIEEAERQLEKTTLEFKSWGLEYLVELTEFCTKASTETGSRSQYFSDINRLAMKLRGQGSTFDYPLISTISTMLYDLTVEGCPEDDKNIKAAEFHIETMRAVIRDDITGDGGETGRHLVEELQIHLKEIDVIT